MRLKSQSIAKSKVMVMVFTAKKRSLGKTRHFFFGGGNSPKRCLAKTLFGINKTDVLSYSSMPG